MTDKQSFIEHWRDRGRERADSQPFWLDLLHEVFGVDNPSTYIRFENPVRLEHKSFIDAYIDATHVLIEQKSITKDLSEPIRQSDGTMLTPYQQARRYAFELPYSKRPRWIIACNFREFHVYDMEKPHDKPEVILLENLDKEYYRLQFLIDEDYIKIQRELEVSIQAGEIVGRLYDALHAQYINPDSDESLRSLNKLCVRLVFCLYAESTGIFGKRKLFRDYLNGARNIRRDLLDLFAVLNTPPEERDPYLDATLKLFPYVNGGLFDDNIEIPNFTDTIRKLLLEEASSGFNWSDISPTIFGAVFESTLNPVTRRAGGMHYTSIENIHKVIDPLFLDDLRGELDSCNTKRKLLAFQRKLASLKFLDPACGSGNFLTEAYLSLRRLENDVLKKLLGEQVRLGEFENPIKVSITQFYGIEINDFAVSVAKTALWISELQMMEETIEIIHRDLDFLPLKSYANIYEDNALRADWNDVAPSINYIMGNPPFSGARVMTPAQKSDVNNIFAGWKNIGNLDYVACWYKKSADFINDTTVRAALISTSSICQGDSVATLWKPLFDANVHIDFAHRSFKWDSESTQKAHVYCIVVGFSKAPNTKPKIIFDDDTKIVAQNINAYLQDAPNVFVESRNKPLCNVPEIGIGNKPIDGGNYLFTFDEMNAFVKKEPAAKKYFKPWYGAEEFLHNKPRYCLWLGDCTPHELQSMPHCLKRVEAVRNYRLQSKSAGTRKIADKPANFHIENMPTGKFIVIPQTSSGARKYIPIGFLDDSVICSAKLLIMPDTDLYYFGVLTSRVHMAWMRMVSGYLGTGYSYSAGIVYNNFVWCNPSAKQRAKIEQTAQLILDTRAKHPDSTLADLYDERTMPLELRKAHRDNDRAVMAAYGFDINMSESEIVAELMRMYSAIAS